MPFKYRAEAEKILQIKEKFQKINEGQNIDQ